MRQNNSFADHFFWQESKGCVVLCRKFVTTGALLLVLVIRSICSAVTYSIHEERGTGRNHINHNTTPNKHKKPPAAAKVKIRGVHSVNTLFKYRQTYLNKEKKKKQINT